MAENAPQSSPEMRDIEARQQSFGAYRERVDNAQATQMDNLDEEYFRDHYDASVPHEGKAVKDEHGRVQELNGIYLDQSLEKYWKRVGEVERARDERKDGRGVLGRIRSFVRRNIDENDIGKGIKIGLKGAAGLGGIFGSSAFGVFAPPVAYAGKRLAVDAAFEAGQYYFERPIIRRLNQLRADRDRQVIDAMEIRNEISNRDNDYALTPGTDTLMSGAVLQDRLQALVTELDRIETQIIQEEANLAHVRAVGKRVRAIAGAAVSLTTIASLFRDGLSMGIQDFDKIGNPHNVTLLAKGVHFVHQAGEPYGAFGAISHAGGELGNLGSVAPWGEIYTSIGALGASMVGGTAYEIGEARRQGEMEERSRNPRAEDEAVFSLRGRKRLGPQSGVQHEVSTGNTLSRGNAETRANLEQQKELYQPGTVWRLPAAPGAVGTTDRFIQVDHWDGTDLYYHELNPAIQMTTAPDGMIVGNLRIERSADDILTRGVRESDNYEGFRHNMSEAGRLARLLETRGGATIETNQNWRATAAYTLHLAGGANEAIGIGDIVKIDELNDDQTRATVTITDAGGNTRGVYYGASVLELVEHGMKVDLDKEAAVNSDEARLTESLDNRGEKLEDNQDWRVHTGFTLTLDGGVNQAVVAGDVIKINKLSNNKTRASVRISDSAGAPKGAGTFNGAHTIEIVNNSASVDLKKEREQNADSQLKQAADIIRRWGTPIKEISPNQFFHLSNAGGPDQWIYITDVDKDRGNITYFVGDGFAAIDGAANPKAKKNALNTAKNAISYPEEQDLAAFLAFVEDGGPSARVNRIEFNSVIK